MKIRDLNLDDYVIVYDIVAYDIVKNEYSEGRTVAGRVDEILFNEDGKNEAIINVTGDLYGITDNNHFDLWSNSIEDKTESVSNNKKPSVRWIKKDTLVTDEGQHIEIPERIMKDPMTDLIGYVDKQINKHTESNDVQQRKRKDNVNSPSHYNYGDIETIDFIEQVTKHYNPNVAYHIGNAIKYLARSPHKNGKEDVDKARWYIERAFENWDVK